MQGNSEFDRFFQPRSIAIIGASRTPGKAGNVVLENILANGYGGQVYPVNPNVEEILGLKCYPAIADIPETPDLAILVVPAANAVATMQECATKGVKALVVTTSGFAETDEAGVQLQREMVNVARAAGMRVMGPNTSGITSMPAGFSASIFPLGKLKRTSVSVIAQTGNFATFTMRWMISGENLGVCRVAGLGNKIDVDEAELLDYFGADEATKAIALYLEGFRSGQRFVEVARRVSRRKPVIALKSGRTASGIRAVASHTASLASNDSVVDAALRQAGVVRVQSYAALVDTIKLLSFQPVPRGNRIAILTPSGACGIIAADACERLGLKVAEPSAKTIAELASFFPSYIRAGNPMDVWGAALVMGVPQAYSRALRAALEDEGIDAVLAMIALAPRSVFNPAPFDAESLSFIPELAREHPEKVVMVAPQGEKTYYEAVKKYLEDHSIPVFTPVEPALEALAYVNQCRLNMGR